MFRFIFAVLAMIPLALAQQFPSFNWAVEVDNSGLDTLAGTGTDAVGNTYLAGSTRSQSFPVKSAVQNHSNSPHGYDAYVTKLDSAGNIVYSTYYGGSGDDNVTAMTVDKAGNVWVTGTTGSMDFPTTPGTWSPAVPTPLYGGPVFGSADLSFLFKLNPDGTVAWSTYFASSPSTPNAIAVGTDGSVYLTGITYGGIPTTPGAYQQMCRCIPIKTFFMSIPVSDTFLTRFDAAGANLIGSTYLGVAQSSGNVLAVAPDGSAYIGSPSGLYRLDATGSSLLASGVPMVYPQALTVTPDGRVVVAGIPASPNSGAAAFKPTAGAFQTDMGTQPSLPAQGASTPEGIVIMDPLLQQTLAATYFGGRYGSQVQALMLDPAGNIWLGGYTSRRNVPTRTPFVEGFGGYNVTGFVSELSGDLTTLQFSSYFGDNEYFGVKGMAAAPNGGFVLAGLAIPVGAQGVSAAGNLWVNSVHPTPPPTLRVDAMVNAASGLGDPVSSGETIVVRGAGFGPDSVVVVGDAQLTPISVTPSAITAAMPQSLPDVAVAVTVRSGGSLSNQVLVPVAATSPGIFSASGTGTGQGYILNQDGTLNTPTNPAGSGEKITIYATGVGPVSFTNGFAETHFPANVLIDSFFCAGVAAVMRPVPGFPGDVYQLTIYVPDPASMAAGNPNLLNFKLPPLVSVVLQMNGAASQDGLAISIKQ